MSRYDLFNSFTSAHLAEALRDLQLPSGGSKPDRVQRLISQDAPPSEILISFSAEALRRTCTVLDIPEGRKAEMVERLAASAIEQSSQDSEESSGDIVPQPTSEPKVGVLSYRTVGQSVLFLAVAASIIFLAFFKDDLQRKSGVEGITGGTAANRLPVRPLSDRLSSTAVPLSKPDPSSSIPTQGGQSGEGLRGPLPGEIVEPDLGEVVARSEAKATPLAGGSVRLVDGASFDVPAGAIDLETELRLVRSKPPLDAPAGLVTDVYYPLSTSRPTLSGTVSLSIPYDPGTFPAGVDEASLRAYAIVSGGSVYAVPFTVDTERNLVVIPNPRVRAMQTPNLTLRAVHRSPAGSGPTDVPNAPATQRYDLAVTGYGLSGKQFGPSEYRCRTGAPGEAHDEPGTIFRMIIQAPVPCEFVRFVATTLQEAADIYNAEYADRKGRKPFGGFSTESRMAVWLNNYPDFSANYDFMLWGPLPDWWGEIEVDVASGSLDRRRLRETLFHELFHGVQDFYSNMFLGGIVANWWYEATAEWAGIDARGLSFGVTVNYEFDSYNYSLSVAADNSHGFNGAAKLSYAYAMLVYYVEGKKPGYVYDTLNDSSQILSGSLYSGLIEAGKLSENYIDFVSQVMAARIPAELWTTATVIERPDSTDIFSRMDLIPGLRPADEERITEESERYRPIKFTGWVPPLTSVIFRVTLAGATGPRRVDVNLSPVDSDTQFPDIPSHDALLLVAASKAELGTSGAPTRTSNLGQATANLNETLRNVWVAVVNNDPDSFRRYTLTITLSKLTDKWQLEGKSSTGCTGGSGIHWDYIFGSDNTPGSVITGAIQLYSREECFLRDRLSVNGVLPGPGAQTVEFEVKDVFANLLGTITFGRDGTFTPDPLTFLK